MKSTLILPFFILVASAASTTSIIRPCPDICVPDPTTTCLEALAPIYPSCQTALNDGGNNASENIECIQDAEVGEGLPEVCYACGCAATSVSPIPAPTSV